MNPETVTAIAVVSITEAVALIGLLLTMFRWKKERPETIAGKQADTDVDRATAFDVLMTAYEKMLEKSLLRDERLLTITEDMAGLKAKAEAQDKRILALEGSLESETTLKNQALREVAELMVKLDVETRRRHGDLDMRDAEITRLNAVIDQQLAKLDAIDDKDKTQDFKEKA